MRRAAGSRGALLLATVLVAGCAAGEVEDGWGGSRTTRADGVTVVDNPAEPLLPPDRPFPLELEGTYGAAEEPPEAILSDRLHVIPAGDGRLYVLDRDASRLVAFDDDGEVLWSAGGSGEGPGELGGASGIVIGPGGEVWVARRQTTVIDRWDPTGQYLDSIRLPVEILPPRPSLGSWIDEGVLIVHGVPGEALLGARFVRLRWTGSELVGDGMFEVRLAAPPDAAVPPEGIPPQVRVTRGRLLSAGPFSYELREHLPDGTLLRLARRPEIRMIGPVWVPELGGRGWFDIVRPPVELSTGHWLAGARWPTNVDDGVAFFRRAIAGDAPEMVSRWTLDLFTPEGRLLATRGGDWDEVPEEYPVAAGEAGRVYTFAADPFPQIRRYRLADGS